MSVKLLKPLIIGAAIVLSAALHPLAATELKVSGSATVAGTVIAPNKAAIEKEAGLTLLVTVNGDGNGLKDLYAGRADAAMVAAPIKDTEAALNKANPGSISVADFEVATVGTFSIRFIVNPANPVKSLTDPQIKDIFTGNITSWKDVGGPDQPILVVAPVPGFGIRTNVESRFLGAGITAKARHMQALAQVAQVVAQAPNAIGFGTAATITNAVAVVPGVEITQALGLVTKGTPNADVKRFIEAAAKIGAASM